MRALIIGSPWVEEILAGRKVWELRSCSVRFRERIGLIRAEGGGIVGTAIVSVGKRCEHASVTSLHLSLQP